VNPAALAAIDEKVAWYVARSAGLVAWALVTATIVWGLALSTRIVRRKGIPAWLLDLHRFLGTLTLVFVAVHVAAIWADSYVHFGPRELFVPMASSWRPGPVAWGIVATYLLAAVQVSSWLMRRIPRRLWRAIHMTSFALFVSATVHGFTSGADNRNLAVQWIALTGTLLVVFLSAFRVLTPKHRSTAPPRREPEPARPRADAVV
jgi:hypothetical protein